MRAKGIVGFYAVFLCLVLSSIPGAANASVYVLWGGNSPSPYSAFNSGSQDIFAILFPHNSASSAFTTNGWSAQLVSRTEWQNGSFTFTDPNGWTAPAPASFDWETVFPMGDPHQQVVAYWLGAGAASPLEAGGLLDGFWTDTYPDDEWQGIALEMNGSAVVVSTTSIPIPLPFFLLLSGFASFAFLRKPVDRTLTAG